MMSKKLWRVEYEGWSVGVCTDYIAADTFDGCIDGFEKIHENSKELIGHTVERSDIISVNRVSHYVHYQFEII